MKRFLQILLGLITAVFIISISVVLTLNAGFLYEAAIDQYDITEVSGLPREEIRDNFQAMIDYNNLGGPETLEFPTFSMSEGGRIHFEEVRHVFHLIEYAAIFCGIAALAGILLAERRRLIEYRLWTGVITIGLPAVCGIYAAAAWDSLFVTFHQLVFHNDYWIFDSATDPVITILPDGYFLNCLIMIVCLALAGAAAFLIWYIAGRRKRNVRRGRDL